VVRLHQVEELRQILGLRLHQSEQDLLVSGTVFANQLDDIIANVQALDESIQGCFNCHHNPALDLELKRLAGLVERYKFQYGTFISAFLNPVRRQELQLEAAATAHEIDELFDELMLPANPRLKARTVGAIAEQARSWKVLATTLILTFLAALLVSVRLVRSVTGPVEKLVEATDRISSGELSFRLQHTERDELGMLMDSFNQMGATLESNRARIDGHVGRLTRLNNAVFSLHATREVATLLPRLAKAMEEVVEAEFYGNVLKTDVEEISAVLVRRAGERTSMARSCVSGPELQLIRERLGSPVIYISKGDDIDWPFGSWVPGTPLRSLLICWIEFREELQGALIAANKQGGQFVEEDGELLSALGHGVVETLENIRHQQELRGKLENLELARVDRSTEEE